MVSLSFVYPYYLWFLLSIPFFISLHFITVEFVKRRAMTFANFEAIKRVGTGVKGGRVLSNHFLLMGIRLSTLILMVLSLSQPILWYFGSSSDFDFVVAIDASGSMLADDFSPNRLEAAKRSAFVFVDEVPRTANLGIVSISGTSYVKQRLTEDFIKVKGAINNIRIETASGTAVGDAIVGSSNLFTENERAKVVVLLTDGQSNVGMIVEEAIDYANTNHVMVHTIGVATEEGGEFSGIDIVSRLDEATLQQIADSTGGGYYRAESEDELSQAFYEIATTTAKKVPVKLGVPLLLTAFVLIVLEWILINTKNRTIP